MEAGCHDTDFQRFLQQLDQWPTYSQYRPLNFERKQIRVLKIWMEPETEDIHAKLLYVELEDEPKYEALSYYWGPPDKQKAVFIDGEKILVRRSLHILLQVLCRNVQTLPVWLDVLCINQANVEERNWQVSIMHEIYRNAACVKAWIGEPTVDSEYAFDYIRFSKRHLLQTSENLHTIQRHARHAFWQLAARPYWTRVWIVQEVAQAQDLIIMCGPRSVEWSALVHASEQLFDSVSEHANLGVPRLYNADLAAKSCFERLDSVRDLTRGSSSHRMLLVEEAIAQFAHHNCEDLRDKFYGLLSIAYGGNKMIVDYRKPLMDVYFDMLSVSLRSSLSQKLLHPRPFNEFADDARYILEHLSIPDEDILEALASEACQLHQPFSELNEFSSYWWMRDFTQRRFQYLFFPASRDDQPREGDLFYELDILDSLKPFRVILRINAPDIIRIVGAIIGPSDERHPTDPTYKQKREKALLLIEFMVSGGMQLCLKRRSHFNLSIHYSKATLLAAICNDCQPSHHLWRWSTPPKARAQAAKESDLPQLCKCNLSSLNAARHQTLIELMDYHSSEVRKRLAATHSIPNSLNYQSIRTGKVRHLAMPQRRQSNLPMRFPTETHETTDQSNTEEEQLIYVVPKRPLDRDLEQQAPTQSDPRHRRSLKVERLPSSRNIRDNLSHNF